MTNQMIIRRVIEAIKQVVPDDQNLIGLHEPCFKANEWDYVKECLDSGWVSSVGKYVDEFERKLADYTGVKRAIAVVNGTAALHICLLVAGVQPNDEVLIPGLTFVATANAVSYCGAVPHFIDSNEMTLGSDPYKLDKYLAEITVKKNGHCVNKTTGRKISTIIPMHTFGHPVDLDALQVVCEKYGLTMIEDVAESLGSFYKGKHTGNWGKISALSFNGNKIITTGGGGAILTNDDVLADYVKHLTTTAKVKHPWAFYHDQIGFNYRMPNINAALGCAQLEQLPSFREKKRILAKRYAKAFESVDGVSFVIEPTNTESNYWLNAIILDKEDQNLRDDLLDATNKFGIMTRPVWTLLNKLPMYQNCPSMDLSTAKSLELRLINIPSSPFLAGEELYA